MPIKLNTASGGGVTLSAANTATDKTITVPAVDGTMNMSGAANEVPAGSASAPAIYPTGDTNTGIFFPAADTIAFAEGGVESARIDSSGNLLVGTTSAAADAVGARLLASNQIQASKSSDWSFRMGRTTSSGIIAEIYYNTSRVGDIATNGSNTTYNSASDYRLKENIVPMTGALEKILTLNPVTYNWKVDGSNGQGFIAHELQEVVPDAVRGVKDEIDENGNPVYQGIDTSFLVATLTAAIQEQQQMIETLQAKVAALEAK